MLGGDTVLQGVGKADVAAAMLRGITADWPGPSDPLYDFEFNLGVFERAWTELSAEFVPTGDKWGMGPVSAWFPDKLHFCPAPEKVNNFVVESSLSFGPQKSPKYSSPKSVSKKCRKLSLNHVTI